MSVSEETDTIDESHDSSSKEQAMSSSTRGVGLDPSAPLMNQKNVPVLSLSALKQRDENDDVGCFLNFFALI